MKGFDAEFRDLEHYIRVITERIWEGRRFEDIRRYYGESCAVETPAGVTIGIDPVIEGTRAALAVFPDRRLLAEDILISGDEDGGWLSSHRIISPMTHLGAGVLGPPSGSKLHVRSVADCVCIDNRIVHEWLVRDQAAIALQIGSTPRALAQRWLDERGAFEKSAMPAAPAPYRSFIDNDALAQRYAAFMQALWTKGTAGVEPQYDAAVSLAAPGGQTLVGHEEVRDFWTGLRAAVSDAVLSIEHLVINRRANRCPAAAMRWRVRGVHGGGRRYGAPTGRPIELLAISHAEFIGEHVQREWVLLDDVAVWMQLLRPSKG